MTPKTTAASSLEWFKLSFRAFKLQPLSFPGIVLFYLLVSLILMSIPLAGSLLSGLWVPFGSVLTALAARDALDGRQPTYMHLKSMFSDSKARGSLMGIGLVMALWQNLTTLVFIQLGEDKISQWTSSADGIAIETIISNMPTTALVVSLALYLPMWIMTLYAPLLVVLKKQSITKSLFFSFFGVLRNLPALIVLAVMYLLFGSAVYSVATFAGSLAGTAGLLAMAPIASILIMTVYQAGIWTSYEGIFGRD